MTGPALNLLVVEDEFLIRWAIASTLAEAGHDVTEAVDAASAIAVLTSGAPLPDVVLLDYRLPDTQNLDLLAQIHALAPAAAIVMMSADQAPEVQDKALACGAWAVVQKPFDMSDVEPLMARAAARLA